MPPAPKRPSIVAPQPDRRPSPSLGQRCLLARLTRAGPGRGGGVNATDEADYIAYVSGRLPVLRRLAASLAGDPHRDDDLVQQAITRLYAHGRRASQAGNLDAYVYKIMLRAFLDEQRLKWASVRLRAAPAEPDTDDSPPAGRTGDPAGAVADRMLLREALATLPAKQRAVLVLRFLADRSVDEVAQILGIAPGTVKSQTHDGLNALRRLLGQPEASDDASDTGPRRGSTLDSGVTP
ncbi:MAG: SigE family RNA polymerase sigma factor [Micromonosporaceae bacterium]|nr:SigE family RNA polymerase sigma factor [Micromonosporaceae bacterium]